MADDGWDPFADDGAGTGDADATAAPDVADAGGSGDKSTLSSEDIDYLSNLLYEQTIKEKPWAPAPNPVPDLTWWTPTCDANFWRHSDILLEFGQGIVYIYFNRPDDQNFITDSMNAAINDAIFMLHHRTDLRIVVFTAKGSMYCAGHPTHHWKREFDMLQKGQTPESKVVLEGGIALNPPAQTARQSMRQFTMKAIQGGAFPDGKVVTSRLFQWKQWHTWATVPQFSLCYIQGSVMGTGIGYVSCCDMSMALKSAFFYLPEVKHGIIPAIISPFLIAKIGPANARRFMITGENLTAEQAKRIGLINEVLENDEQAHSLIKDMCLAVTQCGPRSVEAAKRLIVGVGGQPIVEPIMFYTSKMLTMATISEECRLGMIALQARALKPWEEVPIQPLY